MKGAASIGSTRGRTPALRKAFQGAFQEAFEPSKRGESTERRGLRPTVHRRRCIFTLLPPFRQSEPEILSIEPPLPSTLRAEVLLLRVDFQSPLSQSDFP